MIGVSANTHQFKIIEELCLLLFSFRLHYATVDNDLIKIGLCSFDLFVCCLFADVRCFRSNYEKSLNLSDLLSSLLLLLLLLMMIFCGCCLFCFCFLFLLQLIQQLYTVPFNSIPTNASNGFLHTIIVISVFGLFVYCLFVYSKPIISNVILSNGISTSTISRTSTQLYSKYRTNTHEIAQLQFQSSQIAENIFLSNEFPLLLNRSFGLQFSRFRV